MKQYHWLPNERLHAATQLIVENRVALGKAYPVRSVLFRLMEEGLDRHDAIHADSSIPRAALGQWRYRPCVGIVGLASRRFCSSALLSNPGGRCD
jgi:hypothetical protein